MSPALQLWSNQPFAATLEQRLLGQRFFLQSELQPSLSEVLLATPLTVEGWATGMLFGFQFQRDERGMFYLAPLRHGRCWEPRFHPEKDLHAIPPAMPVVALLFPRLVFAARA